MIDVEALSERPRAVGAAPTLQSKDATDVGRSMRTRRAALLRLIVSGVLPSHFLIALPPLACRLSIPGCICGPSGSAGCLPLFVVAPVVIPGILAPTFWISPRPIRTSRCGLLRIVRPPAPVDGSALFRVGSAPGSVPFGTARFDFRARVVFGASRFLAGLAPRVQPILPALLLAESGHRLRLATLGAAFCANRLGSHRIPCIG